MRQILIAVKSALHLATLRTVLALQLSLAVPMYRKVCPSPVGLKNHLLPIGACAHATVCGTQCLNNL